MGWQFNRVLCGDGGRRPMKIETDGSALELSEVSAAEPDRLITLFVKPGSRGEVER
jgi:hypothetical protein